MRRLVSERKNRPKENREVGLLLGWSPHWPATLLAVWGCSRYYRPLASEPLGAPLALGCRR
jgi:hypothetical protein